jgi:hypothetical protein
MEDDLPVALTVAEFIGILSQLPSDTPVLTYNPKCGGTMGLYPSCLEVTELFEKQVALVINPE